MILITVMSPDASTVIGTSRHLAYQINKRAKKYCIVSGPAPAIIARLKKIYRWQIYLKVDPAIDPAGSSTKKILNNLIEPYERKSSNEIMIQVDVDPL